jgi:hypothetical protein
MSRRNRAERMGELYKVNKVRAVEVCGVEIARMKEL